MPHNVRPLDAVATAIVIALCLSWGFNQVAVKLAMVDIPPLVQATIRSFGALMIVAAWARLRGVALFDADGTLWPGLLSGVLFGLEFVLIYRGLYFSTASRAVLFIYTAPFFVAAGARWLLPGERLLLVHWLGLALCFAGVVVAVGAPDATVDAKMLMGDAMLIGGGAAWAATTLLIKASGLARIATEKAFAYQVAVSVPILAVAALVFGERMSAVPGTASIAWLAYQTVWVVGITYPLWFALLQRYSASRLSAFTFLTPLFGVAAAHIFVGDAITPAFATAVILVIAGLVLVNRQR